MKLDYEILWVENQPDDVCTQMKEIEDYLSDEGFNPRIEILQSDKSFNELLHGHLRIENYDLAVVDRNLGLDKQREGVDIAKQVRHALRYTDIIYYSATDAPALRRAVFEKSIDGVFCTTRGELVETVQGVFEAHLRLFLHVNSVRGLAAASVTEYDVHLRESIELIVKSGETEEERASLEDVVRSTIASVSKSLAESAQRKVGAKGNIHELLRDRAASAGVLADLLVLVWEKRWPQAVSVRTRFESGKYRTDVLEKRNILAHGYYKPDEGMVRLEGRTFSLHPDNCKSLRAILRQYRAVLKDIYDSAPRNA